VRVGRICVFLLVTFALSWGFWWLIAATIGHEAYLGRGLSPLDMLFPAFVALTLRRFVFTESPIHVGHYHGKSCWVLYGFLMLTVVYGAFTLMALRIDGQVVVIQGVGNLLLTLWTLLVLFVIGQSSEEDRQAAGLQLGNKAWGVRLGLGVVAFFLLQAALNALLGLGQWQGPVERIYGLAVLERLYPLALMLAFGLAVTGVPLSGLAVVFGEEYGWRGFLQDELDNLGRRWAALLIGLIWGVWHVPLILSGVHTYPPTLPGLGLGVIFFVLWGILQSYAVLKTRSIWITAFLHGLVNSVYAFTLDYGVYPEDKVRSFGLGVYGLACLTVLVLFVLRDPIWDMRTSGYHR
jgi:membrane protease YdiL (CAAX protease family)